ncbi:hypothetical protein [Aeromicrobium sp. Sec7.5]|uniref:hypothetical protein n=1 Tax=Aeromicrobium sp. Sec7.5 TaxID=3121276 RepID=UPI002FE4C6D0
MTHAPRRLLTCAVAGAAALLVLGSSALSSAATESPYRDVRLQVPAPTPEVVASSSGVTPVPAPRPGSGTTAVDQLSPEEQAWAPYWSMGSALFAIESDHAATFAYACFDGFVGVVGFVGDAPRAAIERLAATGLPYEVHAGVGYTYAEHLDEVDRVSVALVGELDLGSGANSVMVAPSPERGAGRILVTVASTDPAQLRRMADVAADLTVSWPFSLDVESTDDPIVLL